jgi:peptidyl-prolyl cis-trans isomerase C
MENQEIRVSHILVEHEYEIGDIRRKLDQGEEFAALASKFSRCPSAKAGGDLGFFGRGRMVEAFDEAAFNLTVNEISKPVRTRFGYHLIRRTA